MARNSGQDFFEIRISRPLLFSSKQGGLRATAGDEREPPTFQTIGEDLIDGSHSRQTNQHVVCARHAVVCQLPFWRRN